MKPMQSLGYTLYQYEICPFCNKVKGLLDFYNVPYSTVDVNPLTKAEIKFSEGYKKVPIMKTADGSQVNDSPNIIDHVVDNLRATGVMSGEEAEVFCSDEARKWATWADKELAVYIYPNITRNYHESLEAFQYIQDVPHFSFLDKMANMYLGAVAMVFAQGKIKKKYGILNEREEMFDKLGMWVAAVGSEPFLGGKKPNLADVCVFGCIRAIQHTGTHKEIMESTSIQPWYKVRLLIGLVARKPLGISLGDQPGGIPPPLPPPHPASTCAAHGGGRGALFPHLAHVRPGSGVSSARPGLSKSFVSSRSQLEVRSPCMLTTLGCTRVSDPCCPGVGSHPQLTGDVHR